VAALRRAGHGATLLAPASSGAALVGPGPAEADRLLAWDGPEAAGLLAEGGPPPGSFRDQVASHDAAIAYTRSLAIHRSLRALVPRFAAADPLPAPGAGHASWHYARSLAALDVPVEGDPPLLESTPGDRDEAAPWLDALGPGFLAVHPGSGSPAKTWPADRFAALTDALHAGRPWLLVEGPADAAAAQAMAALPRAVHARGLSARGLGALLARARLYVGNDSGVSHVAAAWGAPTLALFGPTDPGVWAPVGPRVVCVRGVGKTMEGIALEDAVTAARALWGSAGG
jgi:ADP-heptose:LPS heptosyltransferase